MSKLTTILLVTILIIVICACIVNSARLFCHKCPEIQILYLPRGALRSSNTRAMVNKTTVPAASLTNAVPRALRTSDAGNTGVHLFGLDGMPKSWVFVLKMGVARTNCVKFIHGTHTGYRCNYFYADSDAPRLVMVSNPLIDDETGPLYRTWMQCTTPSNGYMSWNDENATIHAGGSNPGPISAHSKGFIVYDEAGGVYCNHSCPNWPYNGRDAGSFTSASWDESAPGLYTSLSQHFMLISMDAATMDGMAPVIQSVSPDIYIADSGLVSSATMPLMTAFIANVNNKYHNVVRDKCIVPKQSRGTPANPPTLAQSVRYDILVGGTPVTIYGKSGCANYDYYKYLADQGVCDGHMTVWTFCSPPCILDAEGVTQFNSKPVASSTCIDAAANNWTTNHSKLTVCDSPMSDSIIAAGWNHAPSQLARGSIFVNFHAKEIADQLRCMFAM